MSRPPTRARCRHCIRPFRVAGIPVYGVNGGWTVTPIDNRAHGKDERLPVKSLYDNVVHWELMLRDLASK